MTRPKFCAPPWIRTPDRKPGGRGYKLGRWKSRVKGHPEVNGELPSITLADEIETEGEGQIRAMIVIAGKTESARITIRRSLPSTIRGIAINPMTIPRPVALFRFSTAKYFRILSKPFRSVCLLGLYIASKN